AAATVRSKHHGQDAHVGTQRRQSARQAATQPASDLRGDRCRRDRGDFRGDLLRDAVIVRFVLVAALVACGPAWREFTSEHFALWTDTSESRARELMRSMEDLRHVVIGIGFRGGGAGRVLVIALRDKAESEAVLPPGDFTAI